MADNGSIGGNTLNQRDGLPLKGVDLALHGEGISTTKTSSDKGTFQFEGLAPGKYELTATKGGFETGLFGPLAVVADSETKLNIALQPDSLSE